ncbi:MAG: hypothetical protein KA052_01250 [Candidatus Pacebacteria bacterium]|nr:hypothetical protein [Candidatus Paceibacterota bacterium]
MYSINVLIPAFLWAVTNVIAYKYLAKFDRLVIIQAYTLVGFLCASFLQLLQPDPLANVYNRYNPSSIQGMSGFYLVMFVVFSVVFFAADYNYFGLLEERKYPPHILGIALATVPFFTAILNAVVEWRLPKLSELLACIAAFVLILIIEKGNDIDTAADARWENFLMKCRGL